MGIPTVGFVTEQFKGLANATARGKKMPDLPIIVLPHRYDHLPEEDIREDVRNRVGDVIKTLTQA